MSMELVPNPDDYAGNGDDHEKGLILRTADGDHAAFRTLYGIYYPRLFRFAYRLLGDSEALEEVINDAMYVVWVKATTYDPRCRPSTWIFGIAYNKVRKYFKSEKAGSLQAGSDKDPDELANEGEDWITQIETREWLEAALGRLSAEQRAVIELTYYYGLHYRDIGTVMNCSENTVKTRMHYARKKLSGLLRKDYQPDADSGDT